MEMQQNAAAFIWFVIHQQMWLKVQNTESSEKKLSLTILKQSIVDLDGVCSLLWVMSNLESFTTATLHGTKRNPLLNISK